MTGTVVLDQPQRFLLGMGNVNGDGSAEMFTVATNGLETPTYGQIDVVSFRGRTLNTLLELNGVALATQQVQSLPLDINTADQLSTVILGPVVSGGLPRIPDHGNRPREWRWKHCSQWRDGNRCAIGPDSGASFQRRSRPFAASGPAHRNSPKRARRIGGVSALVRDWDCYGSLESSGPWRHDGHRQLYGAIWVFRSVVGFADRRRDAANHSRHARAYRSGAGGRNPARWDGSMDK